MSTKRPRSVSKSGEVKDEPPKKTQKKRLKTSAPQQSTSHAVTSSPVQLKPPKSCMKLGSLPMYGEQVLEDGFDAIPNLAEKSCSDIKTIMLKIKEMKSAGNQEESELAGLKQTGLINFLNLRKLNRLSHMYCKDAREQTHEQKLGADDLHLQLQNLMYEAMHLRKEITNCLEFKSQHEEIELIEEEELLLSTTTQEAPVDEHDGMLKRLEWELQERKKLAEQQKDLESLIAKEEKDIKFKEDNLGKILPTLEGIRKATLPLQESLGITLDKKREEQEIAVLLPSALYVLFMQAKVYGDIQDSSLLVKIGGDVDEARSFQSTDLENSDDDSGDSDNEGEKNRRKKHRKMDKSAAEKKISRAHPLSIVCKISLKGLGSFEVTFSYLPNFSVVCASVTNVAMTSIHEDLLNIYFDKSSLLHALVDSDTGRTSPNAMVSFLIRKQGNDVFSSAVRTYGFPYKWVQKVCGIHDGVEMSEGNSAPEQQVEISAENIGLVVGKMRERFRSHVFLMQQVIALASGTETHCVPALKQVLQGIKQSSCVLCSWTLTPNIEVQAILNGFVSQSIFNVQERMNKFFHGVFQLEPATLECIVCIGADYPTTPPIFAIAIKLSGEDSTQNIQIKSIEAELNVTYPKLWKSSRDYGQLLLFKQIQKLQHCFQVFMEHNKHPAIPSKSSIRGKGRLLVLKK